MCVHFMPMWNRQSSGRQMTPSSVLLLVSMATAAKLKFEDVVLYSPPPRYPAGSAIAPRDAEPWIDKVMSKLRMRPEKRANCKHLKGKYCAIEWGSWMMLEALLPPSAVVLELGARYGLTSCQIAALQNNSGKLVAVEPDTSVYKELHHNQRYSRCNFGIVHGVVAPTPEYSVTGTGGHGNTLSPVATGGKQIRNIDVRRLETLFGERFDTLVVDCEGCLPRILGQPGLLDHIRLLFIDQDQPYRPVEGAPLVNMSFWHEHLQRLGFVRLWRARETWHPPCNYPDHEGIGSFTAWRRGDQLGARATTCEEHASRHGYTRAMLDCLSDETVRAARARAPIRLGSCGTFVTYQ